MTSVRLQQLPLPVLPAPCRGSLLVAVLLVLSIAHAPQAANAQNVATLSFLNSNYFTLFGLGSETKSLEFRANLWHTLVHERRVIGLNVIKSMLVEPGSRQVNVLINVGQNAAAKATLEGLQTLCVLHPDREIILCNNGAHISPGAIESQEAPTTPPVVTTTDDGGGPDEVDKKGFAFPGLSQLETIILVVAMGIFLLAFIVLCCMKRMTFVRQRAPTRAELASSLTALHAAEADRSFQKRHTTLGMSFMPSRNGTLEKFGSTRNAPSEEYVRTSGHHGGGGGGYMRMGDDEYLDGLMSAGPGRTNQKFGYGITPAREDYARKKSRSKSRERLNNINSGKKADPHAQQHQRSRLMSLLSIATGGGKKKQQQDESKGQVLNEALSDSAGVKKPREKKYRKKRRKSTGDQLDNESDDRQPIISSNVDPHQYRRKLSIADLADVNSPSRRRNSRPDGRSYDHNNVVIAQTPSVIHEVIRQPHRVQEMGKRVGGTTTTTTAASTSTHNNNNNDNDNNVSSRTPKPSGSNPNIRRPIQSQSGPMRDSKIHRSSHIASTELSGSTRTRRRNDQIKTLFSKEGELSAYERKLLLSQGRQTHRNDGIADYDSVASSDGKSSTGEQERRTARKTLFHPHEDLAPSETIRIPTPRAHATSSQGVQFKEDQTPLHQQINLVQQAILDNRRSMDMVGLRHANPGLAHLLTTPCPPRPDEKKVAFDRQAVIVKFPPAPTEVEPDDFESASSLYVASNDGGAPEGQREAQGTPVPPSGLHMTSREVLHEFEAKLRLNGIEQGSDSANEPSPQRIKERTRPGY